MKKSLLLAIVCSVAALSLDAAQPPAKARSAFSPEMARLVSLMRPLTPGPRIKGPATGDGMFVIPMKADRPESRPGFAPSALGPTSILGNFIYSDPVNGVPAHTGLWRFITNGEMIPEYTGAPLTQYAAFEYDGEYIQYCNGGESPFVMYMDSQNFFFYGFKNLPSVDYLATVADTDPVTNNVYGLVYNAAQDGFRFCRIRMEDRSFVPVELKSTGDTQWHAFCFDAAGQAYAIDYDGNLLKVDKTNGETALVGSTGIIPAFAGGATVDKASGRMFWAVCLEDGTSHLYEVDLATAGATHLFRFEHNDQVTGLYIPSSRRSAVPALPTDLKANFTAPELTGTLTFHAPAFTADGKPATGDLTYHVHMTVESGGFNDYEGSTVYGGDVTVNIELPYSGMYHFYVTLTDADGNESDRNVTTMYCGYDSPCAPVVKASYTDGKATVLWDPVTTTVNGGYFDPSTVNYTVRRMPENKIVANKITETTFVDEYIPDASVSNIYYSVIAWEGPVPYQVMGPAGLSNKIFFGTKTVPYLESFNYANVLNEFTIVNANGDSNTWEYNDSNVYISWAEDGKDGDDWLISPPVELYKGHLYTFSYVYAGRSSVEQYGIERLEARFGTDASPEAMTTELQPVTQFFNTNNTTFTRQFTVPEDGVYFFGIHYCSATDMSGVVIDDLSVTGGEAVYAPEAPSEISLVPAPDGSLTVTGTFKAPALDLGGNELKSISAIDVKMGARDVARFDNPVPGSTLTFTDNLTRNGEYTYTITATSDYGTGKSAEAGVYVGVDYASMPVNIQLRETSEGSVSMTWDAPPTDVNANPLDPAKVSYNVFDGTTGELLASGLKETSFTQNDAVPYGEQAALRYIIAPVTQRGQSADYAYSPVIIAGTPYAAPYLESFSDASPWSPLGIYTAVGSAQWRSYIDSSDNDGGCTGVLFYEQNSVSMLYTGKIDLSPLSRPYFTFYTYYGSSEPIANENIVDVKVRVVGTDEWTSLMRKVADEITGTNPGWKRVAVDLSAYAAKCVQLGIEVTQVNFSGCAFDRLSVSDMADNDISVGYLYTTPEVMVGEDINGFVSVSNSGLNAANGLKTSILIDNEPVQVVTSGRIDGGDNVNIPFAIRTDAPMGGRTLKLQASVDANDGTPEDNVTSAARVKVRANKLPAPAALTGEKDGMDISLAWDKPSLDAFEPFTDMSMESADSWVRGLAGWRFVDRDGLPLGGISGVTIPSLSIGVTTGSFFVFDNSAINSDAYTMYDGHKCLVSMYAVNDAEIDDWCISPLLTGEAQELTFRARSFSENYRDKMIVLYSLTDADPDSFVEVLTVDAVPCVPGADNKPLWNEYKVQLPEDAKYFAIRSCAAGGFMLMLDGFDFRAASGSEAIGLLGYNLYRNGLVANTSLLVNETFADRFASDNDKNVYAVSALYDFGESPLSNDVTLEASSLDNSVASGVSVIPLRGAIRIRGAEGQPVLVTNIAGIMMWNSTGTPSMTIPVLPGVYIVKVGSATFKLNIN